MALEMGEILMKYHLAGFTAGFLLDLAFGDPLCLPHPVRLMGKLITYLEGRLIGKGKKKSAERELICGIFLAAVVPVLSALSAFCILAAAYLLHPFAGVLAEAVMTYQMLAAKCLKTESMRVYQCLRDRDLPAARRAVSMIVGRDTKELTKEGIIKATIETVAENTSDGVIAPMLYMAIGGPVLGFFYKAVNTLDSMVGYKNEKYAFFGKASARLDDVLNYIPARISAYLMIAASFLGGSSFCAGNACRIYRRDKRKHASPNSAQTEAVCAGALGIQLAGDASYFGRIVKKPYIGDALRRAECEDIRRADQLMYGSVWICFGICICLLTTAVFLER